MTSLANRTLASAPTVGSFARTRGFRLAAAHREPPHSGECAYRRLVRQNERLPIGRSAPRTPALLRVRLPQARSPERGVHREAGRAVV